MQVHHKLKLSSDLHFGHTNIITGLSHRPKDYEEQIMEHHLAMEEGETWLCLGDVYVGDEGKAKARMLLERLKAKGVPSICVIGNHDPQRFHELMRLGFAMAMDRIQLRFGHQTYVFTHEPLDIVGNMINIHGHLHTIEGHRGGLKKDGRHILISSELLQYRPIDLEIVANFKCTPKFDGEKFRRAL